VYRFTDADERRMPMKPPGQNASGRAAKAAPPRELLEQARQTARNAYAPYSGFRVGAAVQTADGQVFAAANMENASYGLTLCAEAGALQAASSAGALAKVRRIVVAGGPARKGRARSAATPPCGRCRQLIAEAAQLAGCDIEVWYAGLRGSAVERRSAAELLPDAFGPRNLAG
jgi:cytidine deaminase